MNYLAHLLLAGDNPEHQLGGLIADFVRGRVETLAQYYPKPILKGVVDHRRIDSYTDAHPLFLQSRFRLSPERRRVSGVVIDIAYDHFLSVHWARYSDVSREAFIASAYQLLEENCINLPERLRKMAPYMIDGDWLGSYLELENIGIAYDRISDRLRRSNNLAGSLKEVEREYEGLESDFLGFFPQVMGFLKSTESLS